MVKWIILCTLFDIISLFALYKSLCINSEKDYYKEVFYPNFAATWMLIGRLSGSTAQIVFVVLNLIAYFVIYSLSTKKNMQNTVDTHINKEDT